MPINYRRIFSVIRFLFSSFKRYRSQFAAVVALGFLSGLFESIGIAAVIPLFFILTNQPGSEANIISQIIGTVFVWLKIPFQPIPLIIFIVFLFLLKALIQTLVRYVNARIVAGFEEKLRKSLIQRTMNATWPFLLQQKIGNLETILLYDAERSATTLNFLNSTILVATSFLMYASVAFSISPFITLLTVAIGLAIFLLLKPVFYQIRKLFQDAAAIQKDVSHLVGEHIIGAKVIKAAAQENHVLQQAYRYFRKLRDAKVKTALYRHSTSNTIEPLGFILIAILFIISYRTPSFNIAVFAVVMYLIQKMFSYVQSIQSQLHTINELIPYLRTVRIYRRLAGENRESDDGKEKFSFKEAIEFRDISFSYNQDKEILSNIGFKILKGETVGLIGKSGTGKTTVTDLFLRLFTPDRGQILLDGKDIATIRIKEWRKNIGYVPQDMFLLNDTIENNVRFYNASVSGEDIVEATKAAHIYDTIRQLPEGFKTIVGERGVKLSGGQRQRIALARALAQKPQILILDEATSAVDSESETLIQKAIENLRGKITVLVIAHRTSTIINSDKLLVLENGIISEEGSPAELLKNPASYLNRVREETK